MSDQARFETSFVWETSGVVAGEAVVEKAINRLDASEQKAFKAQQARELEASRSRLKAAQDVLRDEEKLVKESHDRRVRLTQEMYKKLDAAERTRSVNLVQEMRMGQIRAGLSPSGTASTRTAGASGGHAGGFLGGQTRMIGDMLDNLTGHSGWVMRLRALEHVLPMVGRALPFLGIAGAAVAVGLEGNKANSRMIGATNSLQNALGEGSHSQWLDHPIIGPLLQRLLPGSGLSVTQGLRGAVSAGGMREQAEQIRKAMEEAQNSRGGFGEFARQFLGTLDPGRTRSWINRRSEESFGAEERAQDRLRRIDASQAGLIANEAQAKRVGMLDPFQGQLAQNRIEQEKRNAEIEDQYRSGKIGLEERRAGLNAAASDRGVADFGARRQHSLSIVGVSEQEGMNNLRARGGSDVEKAQKAAGYERLKATMAIGDVEKGAAAERVRSAEMDVDLAQRNKDIRDQTFHIDRAAAKERGNADERERAAANAAQDRAGATLRILEASKLTTAEERQQAIIAKERADTARIMLEREQRAARAGAVSGDVQANIRFRASGESLGAGAQARQSFEAQSQVDLAREQLRLAQEKAEIEGKSLANVEAIHKAQANLAVSLLQQKGIEMDIARSRRMELESARANVAGIRLANVGRGEIGEVQSERLGSEHAQEEALRNNNPALANELGNEQQARETGRYLRKFYNADGTKKDRGQINRDERDARIRQGKLERAGDRFERDLGLIDVQRDLGGRVVGGTDPFTHEHISAQEAITRRNKAAANVANDRSTADQAFKDIYRVLEERLPKTSQ